MASWKESMINRLSNLINHNRSAPKYRRFYALVNTQPYMFHMAYYLAIPGAPEDKGGEDEHRDCGSAQPD